MKNAIVNNRNMEANTIKHKNKEQVDFVHKPN